MQKIKSKAYYLDVIFTQIVILLVLYALCVFIVPTLVSGGCSGSTGLAQGKIEGLGLVRGGKNLAKFRVKQWYVDMVFMHIMFVLILYVVYTYIVPTIVPVGLVRRSSLQNVQEQAVLGANTELEIKWGKNHSSGFKIIAASRDK